MTIQLRWISIRSIAALLVALFGLFWIFNWFMIPKGTYFWRLNLWPFLVLPFSAGLLAFLLHPRSTLDLKQRAKLLASVYGAVFSLFLLSFGISFATNNTHKYW